MPEVVGRKVTKKEAALRQINASIKHLYNGEYECAATLAGAAEGMLPNTNSPFLFKELAAVPPPPEFEDKKGLDQLAKRNTRLAKA